MEISHIQRVKTRISCHLVWKHFNESPISRDVWFLFPYSLALYMRVYLPSFWLIQTCFTIAVWFPSGMLVIEVLCHCATHWNLSWTGSPPLRSSARSQFFSWSNEGIAEADRGPPKAGDPCCRRCPWQGRKVSCTPGCGSFQLPRGRLHHPAGEGKQAAECRTPYDIARTLIFARNSWQCLERFVTDAASNRCSQVPAGWIPFGTLTSHAPALWQSTSLLFHQLVQKIWGALCRWSTIRNPLRRAWAQGLAVILEFWYVNGFLTLYIYI